MAISLVDFRGGEEKKDFEAGRSRVAIPLVDFHGGQFQVVIPLVDFREGQKKRDFVGFRSQRGNSFS